MDVIRDHIFEQKLQQSLAVLGFISSIDSNLPRKEAFNVVKEASFNFILAYYQHIFKDTLINTEERFAVFRKNYADHCQAKGYCEVVVSSRDELVVKFNRCPFAEVLYEKKLFQYAPAFCLSDIKFTEVYLPEVTFSRESSIVNGASKCIMRWQREVKI